jgi:hypothetical protein
MAASENILRLSLVFTYRKNPRRSGISIFTDHLSWDGRKQNWANRERYILWEHSNPSLDGIYPSLNFKHSREITLYI